MAQLELKTAVLNGEVFRLFKVSGDEVLLPDESGWELVYREMSGFEPLSYIADLDKKLLFDLEPGKYWLIESNLNITQAWSLDVSDATIQRKKVGGVANGFPEQTDEVGKVAVMAPRPIFDVFMELSELPRQ